MGEACLVSNFSGAIHLPMAEAVTSGSQPLSWYALKVRCGGETNALGALESRGYAPYCPTQKERRRYSDRMKTVETPVFPGYLFCQFDVQKKLPIVSAPGVDYIVGSAGVPTAIEENEIEHVRRMVDAGASAVPYLSAGRRVRVTHGALEGVEGILVRDPKGDRLVVSISLLNQSAALHIDQEVICLSE